MRDRRTVRPATEAQLHRFVVGLLSAAAAPGVLWLHIPMGVKSPSGRKAGAWAKAMGARTGAPDFLLIREGQATFLELKRTTGALRPNQRAFKVQAIAAGAQFLVARTPEDVTGILRNLGMIRAATIAA